MAAQETLHGEILLIRPLSLTLLIWLGIVLGAALLGFLFLGRVTYTQQITAVLLPGHATESSANAAVAFDVPSSLAPLVQAGTSLVIRCPGCTGFRQGLTGKVVRAEGPAGPGSATRVIVEVPAAALPLAAGTGSAGSVDLRAEIPLGRTSLIHWLLKPAQ